MSILSRATFSGGAHVPDMKAMSSGKAIETLPAPERAYISLSQHVGKPAIPIVSEGEKVLRGQLIAKADGAVSANIYSSVSGVVEEIKPISNHLGRHTYIVIKNDFLDETVWLEPIDDTDGNAIAERVKEAGLVGLGGAGFPSFIKLKPKEPIDILLINSAECEPYLTCDYRVLVEHTEQFVVGARYLSKALGGAKIYVGVEENKPDVIKTLGEYDDFFVVPLKKKYPQGSEKQLIYACTGRKVGLGKLPSTTGVVVMNVQTTKAVFDAVKLNKPLYERVMTVTGGGIVEPKNILVRIGTPYHSVLEYCGGLKPTARKAVSGGPMMGRVLAGLNGFVRKTDSGLLLLDDKEANQAEPTACINCGRCAAACPMRLMPMYMDLFTHEQKYERAAEYGVMNCFECGTCAYVCPAKRDLVGSIQICKKKLREMKG